MRSPTPIGGGGLGERSESGRNEAAVDWIDQIAAGEK